VSDLLSDHPQLLKVHKAVYTGVIPWEDKHKDMDTCRNIKFEAVNIERDINDSYFGIFATCSPRKIFLR